MFLLLYSEIHTECEETRILLLPQLRSENERRMTMFNLGTLVACCACCLFAGIMIGDKKIAYVDEYIKVAQRVVVM